MSRRVIFKLGHHSYLLPDDKGVALLVKTLSRAIAVEDYRWSGKGITGRDEERSGGMRGGGKSELGRSVPRVERETRVSLGIALLHARAIPGVCYNQDEIAEWAGCTYQAICQIEDKAIRKLRRRIKYLDKSLADLFEELFESRRRPAQRKEIDV